MPDLLLSPERTRLVEMGAGDIVDSLPVLTMQTLFPDAFPLDPDFRAVLLSVENIHDKEMLLRLIFALAFLPQNMSNQNGGLVVEEWEKDPFFRILVRLNRKSCKLYVQRNSYALRQKVKRENDGIKPGSELEWSLPDDFTAKQTLVHITMETLIGFFPSGQAFKESSTLFLTPHLSRRASELDTLLHAMVTILVYPPAENYWPLIPEQRNKIEPLIPQVVHDLEELSKQFQLNG